MKEHQYRTQSSSLFLGKRIGRGGEGEVYEILGDSSHVAKLYFDELASSRESKVKEIISLNLASQTQAAAFPIEAVFASNTNKFSGFVMQRIENHFPIFEAFGPGSRKSRLPTWDYRHLVRTAKNLASTIARIHSTNCIIGDINANGILVSKNATVTLIDTDSFQIGTSNSDFLCKVGVPEYTPPELQGGSLSNAVRNAQHDAFGLAVLIFQLLFIGRHPFQGTFLDGDKELSTAISEDLYVYARGRHINARRPPGMDFFDRVPDPVLAYFDAAFSTGRNGFRPTAENWVGILDEYEKQLAKCAKSQSHYFVRATPCPWCSLENLHALDLFPASLADIEKNLSGASEQALSQKLDSLWKQLANVPSKNTLSILPAIPHADVKPSHAAKKLANVQKWQGIRSAIRWAIVIGCIIGTMMIPDAIIAWGVAGFIGYNLFKSDDEPVPYSQILYDQHEKTYHKAIESWRDRVGLGKLIKTKSKFMSVYTEIQQYDQYTQTTIHNFQRDQHSRQLNNYLDRFLISKHRINRITSGNVAALISFGIETAADITRDRVLQVSGIGPVKSKELLDWRDSKSKLFQPDNNSENEKRELAKIRLKLVTEKKDKLLEAIQLAESIKKLDADVRRQANNRDEKIEDAHLELLQYVANASLFGIHITRTQVPSRAPPVPLPVRKAPPQTQTTSRPKPKLNTAPNCPRCHSPMVLRTARKGSNRGNNFWGCSSFPRCKGTRNV